jgi:IS30 family transposase
MSSKHRDIIAEIHRAINKLGGSAQPATPEEAQRALRDLSAESDLRSIVDSWQNTLSDEQILHLLRNWNAGLPLFQTIYASRFV